MCQRYKAIATTAIRAYNGLCSLPVTIKTERAWLLFSTLQIPNLMLTGWQNGDSCRVPAPSRRNWSPGYVTNGPDTTANSRWVYPMSVKNQALNYSHALQWRSPFSYYMTTVRKIPANLTAHEWLTMQWLVLTLDQEVCIPSPLPWQICHTFPRLNTSGYILCIGSAWHVLQSPQKNPGWTSTLYVFVRIPFLCVTLQDFDHWLG